MNEFYNRNNYSDIFPQFFHADAQCVVLNCPIGKTFYHKMSNQAVVFGSGGLNVHKWVDATRLDDPKDRKNICKGYYRANLNDWRACLKLKMFFHSLLDHIEIPNLLQYSPFCVIPNVSYKLKIYL